MSKVSEMLPEDLRSTFAETMPDNWPDVLESRAGASHLNDTKGTRDILLATAVYLRQSRSASTPAKAVRVMDEIGDEDLASDDRWNAGVNYAIERLCEILGVDPKAISWDAATETLDGDVMSVICNVIVAAYGEEWSSKPEVTAAIRAALSALEDAPQQKVAVIYRHKKGGNYELIGIGNMQAEDWYEPGEQGVGPGGSVDMREVAVYRSINDGSLWVRPREEFEDGRFKTHTHPSTPATGSEHE